LRHQRWLNRLEIARDIASQAQRGEQEGQRAPIETRHGSEWAKYLARAGQLGAPSWTKSAN